MLYKLSFCLISDCDDDYEDEDASCWRYISTAPELCHKIHNCRFRSEPKIKSCRNFAVFSQQKYHKNKIKWKLHARDGRYKKNC